MESQVAGIEKCAVLYSLYLGDILQACYPSSRRIAALIRGLPRRVNVRIAYQTILLRREQSVTAWVAVWQCHLPKAP
jgi:hypothetical protein